MHLRYQNILTYALFALLLFILIVRLISFPLYPLMDTTEARYAEISRKILELNEWVVLYYYDYETPFWGKPPLSFWASAGSMWLFGVNEFGARFAPFIFGVLTCALFFLWRFDGAENRLMRSTACAIILSSSAVGFVSSGAVMTDESLLFCVVLCMISFWRCTISPTHIKSQNLLDSALRQKLFGYLFFIGLGLGLLAKGPLIFVLVGLPIFAFIVATRFLKSKILRLKNLPFFSGTILMLAIALPWYIAFEVKSSGFLEYFIIGEHFKRFFVSGWEGDLYGTAHAEPLGIVWWFFFISFLPWSAIFLGFIAQKIYKFFKMRTCTKSIHLPQNIEMLYLMLWILMPLCFLTFSRNILEAYVLPTAGAFCIICVNFIFGASEKFIRRIWLIPLTLMLILCVFLASGKLNSLIDFRHYKDVFTSWDGDGRLIFIDTKPSFSGYFYAHSTAKSPLKDEFLSLEGAESRGLLNSNEKVCIAIKENNFNANKEKFSDFEIIVAKKEWVLLKNY